MQHEQDKQIRMQARLGCNCKTIVDDYASRDVDDDQEYEIVIVVRFL